MQQEPSSYPTREPLGKTVLRMQMRPGATEPGAAADEPDRIEPEHRSTRELLLLYEKVLVQRVIDGRPIHVPPTTIHTPVERIYTCPLSSCGNVFRSKRTDRQYCSRQCVLKAAEQRRGIRQGTRREPGL